MAVDVISPDARKKVDELFLYWLSEPSTQEILRNEVAKVRGLHYTTGGDLLGGSASLLLPRPASPTARAITPPPPAPSPTLLSPSRSPKLGSRNTTNGLKTCLQSPLSSQTNGVIVTEDIDGPSLLTPVGTTEVKTNGETSHPQIPTISIIPPPPSLPSSNEIIPQFYFPNGKRKKGEEIIIEKVMINVGKIFERYPRQEISKKDFHLVVKALKLPFYWKVPLFRMATTGRNKKYVPLSSFKIAWLNIIGVCHDDASKFVSILSHYDPDKNYLIPQDFEPLVQDIVECHPGLDFLRDAPEFHARYVETVIGRIFYSVDKTWRRRIYPQDLRNSTLLESLSQLEYEDDINKLVNFFSYQHFYVIYCKFWELDTDHDLLIDKLDLIRHADHALTSKIVNQLLSGVVSFDTETPIGKMSYKDFVWFLISEEDKTTTRSIEYWFRVLDKDGDGLLSLYELEYFYEDILFRLEEMNIESLSVQDTICHVLDMINPKLHHAISLKDLKTSQLASMFLNTFINLEKYMDYEQRDAVSSNQDESNGDSIPSDWQKYASEQYELLVAEEQLDDEEEELLEEESDNGIVNVSS